METENTSLVTAIAQIGKTQYQTVVTSGTHTLLADEPMASGGTDMGMSPYDLLLASVASCTAITLRMYINRKMWLIDEVTVNMELFTSTNGVLIESKLAFKGSINGEQRQRLIKIANACPIHKMLTGNVTIKTSV